MEKSGEKSSAKETANATEESEKNPKELFKMTSQMDIMTLDLSQTSPQITIEDSDVMTVSAIVQKIKDEDEEMKAGAGGRRCSLPLGETVAQVPGGVMKEIDVPQDVGRRVSYGEQDYQILKMFAIQSDKSGDEESTAGGTE